MQSGKAKTGGWVLEFEPEPRKIDPLMGYTASSRHEEPDQAGLRQPRGGRGLREKHGIAYRVQQPRRSAAADFLCGQFPL